ncbi:Rv3235 family protein [Spirillospora sp. NPDC029432]|uniref:Rv3235 family protein n=1 Tax=Spirillospora sp. NPDC029432 TaxID=3154599 RepID=UPI00345586E5
MTSSHAVVRIVPKTTAHRVNGTLALRPAPVPPPARRRAHLSVAGGPPRGHAEAALRIVIEILAGTRPPRHLSGTADPEVWQGLAVHRAGTAARTRIAPPRVLRTWVQAPVPGAMETGAVAVLDGRVHALALRLERHHGRWRCTAIETTVPARRP